MALVFAMSGWGSPDAPPRSCTVELVKRADVAKVVTIGDVVAHACSDVAAWKAAPVARFAAGNRVLRITQRDVARALALQAPQLVPVLQWQGPRATLVNEPVQTISGPELAAVAEQAVRARLTAQADVVAHSVAGVAVPTGPYELRVRNPGLRTPSSQERVTVDIVQAGQVVATTVIPVRAKVAGTALRMRAAAAAGDTVTPQDTESAAMDLLMVPDALAVLPGGTIRLRRAVPAGAPLTRNDVLQDGEVMAGDRVDAQSVAGGVQVVLEAVALRGARQGQRLPVRLPHTKQVVQGRLTAHHVVEVE